MSAEMRGAAILPAPLAWRGLSARERSDPMRACKGPSLLTRGLHGGQWNASQSPPRLVKSDFSRGDDSALGSPRSSCLTPRERANPASILGPSLLYRSEHGAAQSSARNHKRPSTGVEQWRGQNRQQFVFDTGEVQMWMDKN